MSMLTPAGEAQLKAQLQDAVVAATERCLYHSAKWCVSAHDAHPSKAVGC